MSRSGPWKTELRRHLRGEDRYAAMICEVNISVFALQRMIYEVNVTPGVWIARFVSRILSDYSVYLRGLYLNQDRRRGICEVNVTASIHLRGQYLSYRPICEVCIFRRERIAWFTRSWSLPASFQAPHLRGECHWKAYLRGIDLSFQGKRASICEVNVTENLIYEGLISAFSNRDTNLVNRDQDLANEDTNLANQSAGDSFS